MLVPLMLLQTLFFKTSDGRVYQTIDNVPAGQCVMTGTEELVYEVSNFNTCNEIVLQPGCYRAELRGGIGTMNEKCSEADEQDTIEMISALFSISEPTTIYALRGGDGNAGSANMSGTMLCSVGGGASGVDSILVVNDRVWRANGGNGKVCDVARYSLHNTTSSGMSYGNGGGGNKDMSTLALNRCIFSIDIYSGNHFAIGGGGGGAPYNIGGLEETSSAKPSADIVVDYGQNGTFNMGGNGGNVSSCRTTDCLDLVSATGGRGGATVEFHCGGQVAYSYGGGGGGASVRTSKTSATLCNGGDGGSGSTGTSNVSFIRIYKM